MQLRNLSSSIKIMPFAIFQKPNFLLLFTFTKIIKKNLSELYSKSYIRFFILEFFI